MIEAKDLNIGDFIIYNGEYCQISSVESPLPRKDPRFDGKYLVTLYKNGFVIAGLDEIDYIPITDEILSLFCEKSTVENGYTYHGILIRKTADYNNGNAWYATYYFSHTKVNIPVKYFNQMQHIKNILEL